MAESLLWYNSITKALRPGKGYGSGVYHVKGASGGHWQVAGQSRPTLGVGAVLPEIFPVALLPDRALLEHGFGPGQRPPHAAQFHAVVDQGNADTTPAG